MPSIRSLLVLGLPLFLPLCVAQPRQTPIPSNDEPPDVPSFEELVEWLPEDSVRSALADHLPKYREGVFEHGKDAIQRIKNESPALAKQLVGQALHKEIKKQDLRKRQAASSNSTAAASSADSSSFSSPSSSSDPTSSSPSKASSSSAASPPPSSSSAPISTGVLVSVPVTTTESGTTKVQTVIAIQTTAETTVGVLTTSTDAQGNEVTKTTKVPATIITSTDDSGNTITTTSALKTVAVDDGTVLKPETTTDQFGNSVVLTGNHKGATVTATDAKGKTVVLTFTPHGGVPVSELVLKTTRLPNGQVSTYTSFAHVGAATANPDHAGHHTTTKHNLQSGLASATGRYMGEIAVLFGGAIGVAALL